MPVVAGWRVYGGSVSLPETDVARVRRSVAARNERMPAEARDQVRYELDVGDRALTVVECRGPWRPEAGPEWTRFPIVRFRYTKARGEWTIYWRDRNLRFHRFEPVEPSRRIDVLLTAVGNRRCLRSALGVHLDHRWRVASDR